MTSNLETLHPIWEAHCSRAQDLIPEIHIESKGEIVYLGELSPGCKACKAGVWDCIFITMKCNLSCDFCYSPHSIPEIHVGSGFGYSPKQILTNYDKSNISGVSFSGGEPFLEPEKLFAWLEAFRSLYPANYYWVYTNGLLVEKSHLQRLGELGLNEIRFNTAASGYDHPVVMRNLAFAKMYIQNVTVEIPSIPAHAEKLLSVLGKWSALGVKFLNLHELMYEPESNSEKMGGHRQSVVTNEGHYTEINPQSRSLSLTVMEKVIQENLHLFVNDCSLQSKLRQLRGRQQKLAELTKDEQTKLLPDNTFETYCAYRNKEDYLFFHPDFYEEFSFHFRDYTVVRLVRTAPLSISDQGIWKTFEWIS